VAEVVWVCWRAPRAAGGGGGGRGPGRRAATTRAPPPPPDPRPRKIVEGGPRTGSGPRQPYVACHAARTGVSRPPHHPWRTLAPALLVGPHAHPGLTLRPSATPRLLRATPRRNTSALVMTRISLTRSFSHPTTCRPSPPRGARRFLILFALGGPPSPASTARLPPSPSSDRGAGGRPTRTCPRLRRLSRWPKRR